MTHRTHTDVGYVPYFTEPSGRTLIGMKFRDLDQLRDQLDPEPGTTVAIEKITITYEYEWVDLDPSGT